MELITREELIDRFSYVDYAVFCVMLLMSALIGVFYGFFAKKMKNTDDFLMAGKSMGTFPVAMSLIASFMSAIALLGTPSEVYQNGFMYILIGISYTLVMPAAAFLYLPVFWNLQVTSAYEYLEIRFHRSVRQLGSFVFILQMVMYMAIVVYAPALALQQVTGVNVYLSVCLICFVCVFYTTLGGMKAVLWTDALQVGVMYASVLFIVIKGAMDEGGFQRVWEVSREGLRTQMWDFNPDPRVRHTFWSLLIGGYFTWITIYGVNQAQVQRYLCVKEKKLAIRALFVNLLGLYVLLTITCFAGLVIYAKYVDCDPVSSQLVKKHDQLFPLFVMDNFGTYHGLAGLFVSGIFAGSLSTVSSGINSLAAITLEDFIKPVFPAVTEASATMASKGLSFFYGLVTFILVFVAERLGDVLSAALGIFGMIGGPLLGVFTLGMFFPWANAKGAFVGTILGIMFTIWIGVGQQIAIRTGDMPSFKLELNKCTIENNNGTLSAGPYIEPPTNATDEWESLGPIAELYKISYIWFSAVGCLSTILFAMIVSFITGIQDLKTLNPMLLSPAVSWCKCIIPGFRNIGIDLEEENAFEIPSKPSTGDFTNQAMEISYPSTNDLIDSHIEKTKL